MSLIKVFEQHEKLSVKRLISGMPEGRFIWIFNRNRWTYWKNITNASAKRLQRLVEIGEQVWFSQWEFPDRIEGRKDATA